MSADALRVFWAVALPDEARAQAAAAAHSLAKEFGDDMRAAAPETWHLTLKFLGDFPAERIDELVARCAPRGAQIRPFPVELAGLGAFPTPREARVLWLGVSRGARELARLARGLDRSCARFGSERDRKPYAAHLTLGRLREPRPVLFDRVEAPSGTPFVVEEIVLFESRLSPGGARHLPLARLPLGAGAEQGDLAPEL